MRARCTTRYTEFEDYTTRYNSWYSGRTARLTTPREHFDYSVSRDTSVKHTDSIGHARVSRVACGRGKIVAGGAVGGTGGTDALCAVFQLER